jgi:predicted small metal-binding protein
MKQFACGAVVPGCDALWVCSSEEQILTLVATHLRDDHGLEITAELMDRVAEAIWTVPAAASVLAGAAA